MPTSNGLVTSRDIRQAAVKSVHILDEAVTTAKIPDLAVTYPDKIDAPFWVEVQSQQVNVTGTVTTTETTFATVTVTVPAWVNQVSVFGVAEYQLSNSSGAETLLHGHVLVDGSQTNGGSHEISDSSTQHMSLAFVHFVSNAAGSSVTVELTAFVSTGSHSSHNEELYVLAVGSR